MGPAHSVPMMQCGCPWTDLSHAWPPNVKWCEAQVCGWIVEPANTWSNLGYILIGLGLLIYALPHRRLLSWFGWAEVAVGVTSFVYHMAWNALFQWLDFLGMYLFAGLPLILNLGRLGVLKPSQLLAAYGILVAALGAITPLFNHLGAPIQLIVLVLIIGILVTEWRQPERSAHYGLFWLSFVLLGVAFGFSMADLTRAWCHPENHVLQGHAIWHVLGAFSLWALAGYYQQFEARLRPPAASLPSTR